MSHVISSQPSSTSPYQPTEVVDTANGNNPPRILGRMDSRRGHDDCCFRADRSQGCFLYYCCSFFNTVCGGIRDCTERCCECCADSLNDCCEDKPNERDRRRRNKSRGSVELQDGYDDNTWVVGAIQHHKSIAGTDDDQVQVVQTSNTSATKQSDGDKHCHSGGHDSGTHHGQSDSGHHHSSSGNHDSGGTGGCDTGGDSGGACDTGGGGDTGGGCDSGGGGDSGGCCND